ncbi:glycosyltransferase [Phytoactinopolyspora limicola]|uniref:glycosyltransferase n=1 Tax=Phytoactinopolyspora limicola TaxID=2715536 RepID=UPI00140B47DE
MRVLVITHGTRGDVQPFVALAQALSVAGHEPVLVMPKGFSALAEPHGVHVEAIHDAFGEFGKDPTVRAAYEINFRGVRGKRLAIEFMRRYRGSIARAFDDIAAVVDHCDADLVVHLPNIPGHEVAERLGVPSVAGCLQPGWVPTDSFPNPLISLPLPRAFNRMSYVATRLWSRAQNGSTRKWRRTALGLSSRRRRADIFRRPDGSRAIALHAFSQYLLPPSTSYPSWAHTTGFWSLPAPPDWRPPARLVNFLASGEPPIYVGFGSVAGSDPARAAQVVTKAVKQAGVRALLVKGWGGIRSAQETPDDILVLDDVPFEWLFSRVSLIVHHGGVGTIGAALASGRPQVVCPFMYEQPFTARRMHAIGVAPPPISQTELTADSLASAIREALTDRSSIYRAEEAGDLVRSERGTAVAVKILESLT